MLLAGQQIGRVRSVDFATAPDGSATAVNSVGVEVRGNLTLYENAGVYLQLPLLGTLSSINISSVGTPAATPHAGSKQLAIEEDEVVTGRVQRRPGSWPKPVTAVNRPRNSATPWRRWRSR